MQICAYVLVDRVMAQVGTLAHIFYRLCNKLYVCVRAHAYAHACVQGYRSKQKIAKIEEEIHTRREENNLP